MSTASSNDGLPPAAETELTGVGRAARTVPPVTLEARRYALKELARRAGVSREFFEKWSITVTPERTTISFGPEVRGSIEFPHELESEKDKSTSDEFPVARAGWMRDPGEFPNVPNLIIPFCNSRSDEREPLYRTSSSITATCRLDLLRSFLFTLTRVEETSCSSFDEHRRFPASASLAVRHNFLERPILDEHGLAFQQALSVLCPGWRPSPPPFRVKLTHDIDDIGIPFELRTAVAHSLKRHKLGATLRDFLSFQTPVHPAELSAVLQLADISSARLMRSAFYWKASPRGAHDSGYDPAQSKVRQVVDSLRQRGFELGVHPGYETFQDRAALAVEVDRLRQALGVISPGGRQHYLRWSPATWLDWEACGLAYDSSVGFAERFGFRAGTAFPYHPWSFADNRELHLVEVPLILMDCTAVKYMRLSKKEGLERIETLIQRTRRTGGVFTLLWHNTPLLDPEYDGWYEAILDLLDGAPHFELPAIGSEWW